MSGPYGSRFARPEPEDLETVLARALRAEAERVMPVGDGLAKIRARTEGRSLLGWLAGPFVRPVLAGGTLVLTLVAGSMLGRQLTAGSGPATLAEGSPSPVAVRSFTPAPKTMVDPTPEPEVPGGYGGVEPEVDTPTTAVPASRSAPVVALPPEVVQRQNDLGIPQDDGRHHVAILAPLSGGSYSSPLMLVGKARVYEGAVTIDISQNGTVLQRAYATATAAGPELGDWEATIALAPGNYRIDVYALSPEDGESRLASDSIWISIEPTAGPATPEVEASEISRSTP